MTDMNLPERKIALITGGSRGLGRSIAINLAKAGVDSIITFNNRADEAQKVVDEIGELGRRAIPLQLDVGQSKEFAAFAEAVSGAIESLGDNRMDFLVNNAGTSHGKTFADTTEEELDGLYDVHLKGPFFLTQKLLPLVRDGGRIVNMSSGLTRIIMPNRAAYGTMKGAIETLTKYMAFELAPRRIAVNVVAPGAISTDFSGGVARDNPAVNKAIADMTALGRVGDAEDIGMMVASLLSEQNRWINGERIEVSGGMRI
jgi:NAD(P)-dependent dehydrogenase (short-subunit alcohol dehydrogenase family)